jgi:hypothetical protein
LAFKEMVTPVAVTAEVVKAVMKAKNMSERGALFALGFRLDKNLMTKTHMVRCSHQPFKIYEAKVFHGLLRNKVAYTTDSVGNVEILYKDGKMQFTKQPHDLKSTYELHTVVGMQNLNRQNVVHINNYGNPEA